MNSRPAIFISYSHRDDKWRDRVVTHLRVSEQERLLELWDDTRITTGDDWHETIRRALEDAIAAILLVSANFLTSTFIRSEEIPRLLQRRATKGVRIFPIIVEPCDYEAVEWLRRMEVRPKDGRALSTMRKPAVDRQLAAIAREVRASGRDEELAQRGAGPEKPSPVRGRILWVDDYPTNNEQMIKAWRARGVSFDLAIDNAQALEYLDHERYQLVITDMGRGSEKEAGLRFLRELRRRLAVPPTVIVFSGVPVDDHRYEAALEEGALLVTYDAVTLNAKIGEVLGFR